MGTSSLFIARFFWSILYSRCCGGRFLFTLPVGCSPSLESHSPLLPPPPPPRNKNPAPFRTPHGTLVTPLPSRRWSVCRRLHQTRPSSPIPFPLDRREGLLIRPPVRQEGLHLPPPARRVLPTPPAATDVGDTSSSRRAFLAATADAAAAADAAVAPPPLTDAASFSRRALSSLRCVYVKTPAMVSTMPATDFTSRGRPKSRKSCGRQRRGGSVYDQVKKHARRRSERDKHKKLSGQYSYDVRVSIERGWSNRSCSSSHAHLTMS